MSSFAKPHAKPSAKRSHHDVVDPATAEAEALGIDTTPMSVFNLGAQAVTQEAYQKAFVFAMSAPPAAMDIDEAVPVHAPVHANVSVPVIVVEEEPAVPAAVIPANFSISSRFVDWTKITTTDPSIEFTEDERRCLDLVTMVHNACLTIRSPFWSTNQGECTDTFREDGVKIDHDRIFFVLDRVCTSLFPEGFLSIHSIRETEFWAYAIRPKRGEDEKKGPDPAVACFLGPNSTKVIVSCTPNSITVFHTGGENDNDHDSLKRGRTNNALKKKLGFVPKRDDLNMGAWDGTTAIMITAPGYTGFPDRTFLLWLGHDAMIMNPYSKPTSNRVPAHVMVMYFSGEIMPASLSETPWGLINWDLARTSLMFFFTKAQWHFLKTTTHDALVGYWTHFTEVIRSDMPADKTLELLNMLLENDGFTSSFTFAEGTPQSEIDAVLGSGVLVVHTGPQGTKVPRGVGRAEIATDNGGRPWVADVAITAASAAAGDRMGQQARIQFVRKHINLWDVKQLANKTKAKEDQAKARAQRKAEKEKLLTSADIPDEEVEVFSGLIELIDGSDTISNSNLKGIDRIMRNDDNTDTAFGVLLGSFTEDKLAGLHAGAALSASTNILTNNPAGHFSLLPGLITKFELAESRSKIIRDFPSPHFPLEAVDMYSAAAVHMVGAHVPAENSCNEFDIESRPAKLKGLIVKVLKVPKAAGAPQKEAELLTVLDWAMKYTVLDATKDVWRHVLLALVQEIIHLATRDDLYESRNEAVRILTILRIQMATHPFEALTELIPVLPVKKSRKSNTTTKAIKAIKPPAARDTEFDN